MAAPPLPELILPPISPTSYRRSPKSCFPASTAPAGARRATPFVACSAAAVRTGEGVNPDDYHSTLRALNSKGRMPRKSLGQVRYPTPFLSDYPLVTRHRFFQLLLNYWEILGNIGKCIR